MNKAAVIALLCLCTTAKAQLPFKGTNEISPVLSKIIHDYPTGFSNSKGDQIDGNAQVLNYECLLAIKGVEPGVITQYGDEQEKAYSWKNTLLETTDYAEAAKKFKQYYAFIKKTDAIINNLAVKPVATYIEPNENKQFNTILFRLQSLEESVKDVAIDLSMQYEMDQWKVVVSLYHVEDANNSLAVKGGE